MPRAAPVLLTLPEYCGTLAAVRAAGALGVEVWTAAASVLAPGQYSKYVRRRLRCPGLDQPEALLQWLLDEGARNPGAVLYPTADDVAWLQAVHANELSRHFRLYAPAAEVLEALLDKRSLAEGAAAVGLETPHTWFPESEEELAAAARDAPMPALIKQRTQIFSSSHSKGVRVSQRDELVTRYREFRRGNHHAKAVLERRPGSSWPLIQAYHSEALSESYLVDGFIDRSFEHVAARAARKLIQRPRELGIALCLEAAPLDEALIAKVAALCRRIGYYGVFQAEFLVVGGRRLLIDFNPRYFHYMAFSHARGLPLARLAYLAACGEDAQLEQTLAAARVEPPGSAKAFTYRLALNELLLAQTLSGAMSRAEAGTWREWAEAHHAHLIDAVAAGDDPLPRLVDGAWHVAHRLRHPRSFLRQIARRAAG